MENSALTQSGTRWARALLLLLIGLQAGCTTVQTTYFRSSYQPVENLDNPALAPFSGESRFQEVSNMADSATDMYNDGYVMPPPSATALSVARFSPPASRSPSEA